MFIQAPATTWSIWFMANIAPLILSFLAIVVPAAALWIKAKLSAQLNENHAIAVAAAESAQTAASAVAAHTVDANQKLASIQSTVSNIQANQK